MICPRSSRFPNTWSKAALLALGCALLPACAGSAPPPAEETAPAVSGSRARSLSDQFQWAVQDYEAGKYTEAAEKFRRLEASGAETPEFDLVPFYLGMCYYRGGQYAPATDRLRAFLKGERNGEMAQDARLALLTIYERTQRWDDLLGLAAETDPLPLFQDNRAFLKLLWARALEAKGE
jgi:TolA-binding protein